MKSALVAQGVNMRRGMCSNEHDCGRNMFSGISKRLSLSKCPRCLPGGMSSCGETASALVKRRS